MAYPAHKLHTDQIHFLKAYVNATDADVVAGTKTIGTLPKNSFILATHVYMSTVGTANNALTVGTASGTANNIVTAGDVNETVSAVTRVAGIGVINSTTDYPVYVKHSGGTSGAAYIVVEYIPMPPQ